MTSRILASLAKEWRKWDAENTDTEKTMDYYERKQKDSVDMTMLLVWLFIITVALATWYCTYKWLTHKCPEPAGSVQTVQKGD